MGADLERWLLKVTCGFRAVAQQVVPLQWLKVLFGEAALASPIGLYMHATIGTQLTTTDEIEFGGYRDSRGQSGAEVSFYGFRFTLDLRGEERTHRPNDAGSLKLHHPEGIWFEHGGRPSLFLWFHWLNSPFADGLVVNVP
jgi:hypothetical protein